MKKRKSKTKKIPDSQKIEHLLQSALEHIAHKWGWYVLGIFGFYALISGWLLKAFFFILECFFEGYYWFTDGLRKIIEKPIMSLSLSDIGELLFRISIALFIYAIVRGLYQSYHEKDEVQEESF
jgi:hypothetical protein